MERLGSRPSLADEIARLWGAKNRITSLAADGVTTKQTYRSLDGEQMIVWVAPG
jgi:hypothetical protein